MTDDAYSATYREWVQTLAAHAVRLDPIEQEAVENAVLVDFAMDEATENFRKLNTDHRGLARATT